MCDSKFSWDYFAILAQTEISIHKKIPLFHKKNQIVVDECEKIAEAE